MVFKAATKKEVEEIEYWLVNEAALAEYSLSYMNSDSHRHNFSDGEIQDVKDWLKELRFRRITLHLLFNKNGWRSRLDCLKEYCQPHKNTIKAMSEFRNERERWLKKNNYRIGLSFDLEKVKK